MARVKFAPTNADPLLAGFFTNTEAATLVEASQAVIRGWLNGYTNRTVGPLVEREFFESRTVSFLDLMELRFVRVFRSAGVSMRTLRLAVERLRRDWQVSHPLAMSNEKYLTDRRSIFAQVAEDEHDELTWDMANGQYMMWDVIESSIAEDVVYEPDQYRPVSWKPRPRFRVIIDPRVAFGRSTVEGTKVPTSVIYNQWEAEQHNESRVANWFNVSLKDVRTAIGYERALAA